MPRSEMPEIPREILQDTLIEEMEENDRLRARIAALSAAAITSANMLKAENAELKRRLQALELFLAAIHMTDLNAPEETDDITDGFENYWPRYCNNCGALNEIYRPGDCRCSKECYLDREGK